LDTGEFTAKSAKSAKLELGISPAKAQRRKGKKKMSFRPKGEIFFRFFVSARNDGLHPSLCVFAPLRENIPNYPSAHVRRQPRGADLADGAD
jgi:hypothetical protein